MSRAGGVTVVGGVEAVGASVAASPVVEAVAASPIVEAVCIPESPRASTKGSAIGRDGGDRTPGASDPDAFLFAEPQSSI